MAELKCMISLLNSLRFNVGDRLVHKKSGSRYTIIGAAYLEKTLEPAYIYASGGAVVFVRPSDEMEDGRFEREDQYNAECPIEYTQEPT